MAFRTPETLAQVPPEFRSRIQEFQRRYDPSEHVVVGGSNVDLMNELGLTEFLADFDTTAGPQEMVTDMLRKLEGLGVSTFIAALPGHADPRSEERRVGKEGVSTCRSRWASYNKKKKQQT